MGKRGPYQNQTLPTCEICGGRIRGDSSKVHRRVCEVCGDLYCNPNGTGKVCSEDCRRKLISKKVSRYMKTLKTCRRCGRRRIGGGKQTHNRTCPVCGKKFCRPYGDGQRLTCSEACRRQSQVEKNSSPICDVCGNSSARSGKLRHAQTCVICEATYCGQGQTCSDECRYILSGASHRGHPPYTGSGRGKCGIREDLGCYFRSTWEANYARILNLRGRTWQYEPRVFTFEDGTTYRPDFYVKQQGYIEIKGYESEEWEEKLAQFREQFPRTKLTVVGLDLYRRLRRRYKDRIVTWEDDGLADTT